jgi:hypothetical protein
MLGVAGFLGWVGVDGWMDGVILGRRKGRGKNGGWDEDEMRWGIKMEWNGIGEWYRY